MHLNKKLIYFILSWTLPSFFYSSSLKLLHLFNSSTTYIPSKESNPIDFLMCPIFFASFLLAELLIMLF
jgi:hypothetical protein